MDNIVGMHGRHRVADLQRDVTNPRPDQRTLAAQRGRQILTREQLHHIVAGAVRSPPGIDHADDPRVMDARGDQRLAQKPTQRAVALAQARLQQLDRVRQAARGVLGEVHRAHAALADAAHEANLDPLPEHDADKWICLTHWAARIPHATSS